MSYSGIDYKVVNVDHATDMRYGVISQGSIFEAWDDRAVPEYGDPSCPECGSKVEEYETNYHCAKCEKDFDPHRCSPEYPIGWSYESDGYKLTDCLDSDVMVIASPYFTHAAFCSPCVPGAGDLNAPREGGPKTYCLGHDWFEGGRAPYPVYSVTTRKIVPPDKEE